MTDNALRQALRQQAEQQPSPQLPSNFTYLTLQRIRRRQAKREHREQIAAICAISLTALLGLSVLVWLYGRALLAGLQAMVSHPEGLRLLPALTFCAVFFAVLNGFLRKKFS